MTVDYDDPKLLDHMKFAVQKGSEVMVTNFRFPCPPPLKDLFERRLEEKVQKSYLCTRKLFCIS